MDSQHIALQSFTHILTLIHPIFPNHFAAALQVIRYNYVSGWFRAIYWRTDLQATISGSRSMVLNTWKKNKWHMQEGKSYGGGICNPVILF